MRLCLEVPLHNRMSKDIDAYAALSVQQRADIIAYIKTNAK